MSAQINEHLNDVAEAATPENYWAALDIGSNSFHFVYVRERDNQLQILHREKYEVQLALGLDEQNRLSEAAMQQGLEVLTQLALTTENLSSDSFRVVATYTLRTAINAKQFLKRAKQVFPFDIEIISGHEEARLIYQGVAHNHSSNEQRLVIDIGGGSTECIIGQQLNTSVLASVPMGCVSYQQQFFADGVISAQQFQMAIITAKIEMESMVTRFKKVGWQLAIGTSGTIKAIANLITEQNTPNSVHLTLAELHQLKHQLIDFGHVSAITFSSLKDKRRPVLCSGLAILIAVFEMLDIKQMEYCDYSLRDGVLIEMMELADVTDVRQRAITSLQERFAVDSSQVTNVSVLAKTIFDAVQSPWQLTKSIYQKLLFWAIQVHEIGLDINSSGYHTHGEYILTYSDLAGFNQEQQAALAWLVGNQRKKIHVLADETFDALKVEKIHQLGVILRLAVLLQQQRNLAQLPTISVVANRQLLTLSFDDNWLQQRQLLNEELLHEIKLLAKLDVQVQLN